MLEALLSARRVLYVSWAGRSVRDNSEQPPSVLVSQLRDYLAAGWGERGAAARTTEHPLQPFSRRYFEVPGRGLRVDCGAARPCFSARAGMAGGAHGAGRRLPAPRRAAAPAGCRRRRGAEVPLTVAALVSFLRNPVKDFFRRRLNVVFGDDEDAADDDEPFAVTGLAEYALMQRADRRARRARSTPGRWPTWPPW